MITPLIIQLFEVGCQAATLYQLADGSAVLKLGLDGILDGISRVSTYHGPLIRCQFLLQVLPSPSLGDGLSTGSMALWINNSENGSCCIVEVVFIYNGYSCGETHS